MNEQRKHPDLFNAAEAAEYLHLPSERTLEIVRRDFGLRGISGVSKGFLYWRADLDDAALRMAGRHPTGQPKSLRIAGVR